jgi:hypothetical protein
LAKDKRVEVLFEPDQYRLLEDAAHRSGKSIGWMVREAVAKYVTMPSREERMAAMERFLALPPVSVGDPEELKAEIIKDMDDYLERKLTPEAD